MSQKLKDLKLLMKTDRRVMAVGGFLGAVLFIWLFTGNWGGTGNGAANNRNYSGNNGRGNSPVAPQDKIYNDVITAQQNKLDQITTEKVELQAKVDRMKTDTDQQNEKVKNLFVTMVDRIENMQGDLDKLKNTPTTQGNVQLTGPQGPVGNESGIQAYGFESNNLPPPPAPTPVRERAVSVVSPGDSVKIKLLSGVMAPTDGTPYPTVFKIMGPITGPDGSSLEVGEARILAAAQGSEIDGRAIFRMSTMSMRMPDGRRSTVKVDGWVLGEDGIRGLQGHVIDKLGRLIAATAGISFGASLSQSLLFRNQQFNIINNGVPQGINFQPGDVDRAFASALTDASNRLGTILLNRYERMVPVVEVLSGREVVAVFSSQTEISPLEDENDEGIYTASLD